jgi:hypothetical protein
MFGVGMLRWSDSETNVRFVFSFCLSMHVGKQSDVNDGKNMSGSNYENYVMLGTRPVVNVMNNLKNVCNPTCNLIVQGRIIGYNKCFNSK